MVIFAAAAASAVWALETAESDSIQAVASVIEVLLAAIGIGGTVLSFVAARKTPTTPEQRDLALRWLVDEMRVQLREDRHARGLTAPELIAMRWRVRPPQFSVSDTPGERRDRPATGEGPLDLVDLMARVGSPRVALIGSPGAGKSTFAGLLAAAMLDREEGDQHVPVVVSLADWAPPVEDLDKWTGLQLAAQYPGLRRRSRYGSDAAESLITHTKIFPILDGLDEVREE
jgi:hypothetical protein